MPSSKPSGTTPIISPPWTDEELRAAITAYLAMLRDELLGQPYTKSVVNLALREGPLADRNKSSVELRMQNISALLSNLRLPYIRGYLPARSIGSGVKERMKRILESLDLSFFSPYQLTADPVKLDQKVAQLRQPSVDLRPIGNEHPQRESVTVTGFVRDPAVKRWVLDNANGCCEGCSTSAPFMSDSGFPYLEVHHIVPLASGGSDRIRNALALCPNCHRRCHYSVDRDMFKLSLYERIPRLQVEVPTARDDDSDLHVHLPDE